MRLITEYSCTVEYCSTQRHRHDQSCCGQHKAHTQARTHIPIILRWTKPSFKCRFKEEAACGKNLIFLASVLQCWSNVRKRTLATRLSVDRGQAQLVYSCLRKIDVALWMTQGDTHSPRYHLVSSTNRNTRQNISVCQHLHVSSDTSAM